MGQEASVMYELTWKREGWTRSSKELCLTKRAAFSRAAKLNHATQAFDVKPITEMRIRAGAIMWGADVPIPDTIEVGKRTPKVADDAPVWEQLGMTEDDYFEARRRGEL